MSRVNPRLVYWIAALHQQPGLHATQRDLLTYLAVKRLDYGTGSGYCSVRSLAEAKGVHESTVKRALDLAQQAGLLRRTRRGHRIADGVVAASEWQLIYPPTAQPDDVGEPTAQPDDVGSKPTAQEGTPNSALEQSQQRTGAPLQKFCQVVILQQVKTPALRAGPVAHATARRSAVATSARSPRS